LKTPPNPPSRLQGLPQCFHSLNKQEKPKTLRTKTDSILFFLERILKKRFYTDMITDDQLGLLANMLGATIFALIIVYHYVEANARKTP